VIDLAGMLLGTRQTLREAMECLNANAKGVVLVVDGNRRLLCTITDGDLRRAILDRISQDTTIADWMTRSASTKPIRPITAPVGTGPDELARLMRGGYHHIPLIDKDGRVADLAMMSDFVTEAEAMPRAVVMAGGRGTRLRPLTAELPKPMLKIGNKPLMEHIITGLRDAGVNEVRISTHYKAEAITNYFGDGQRFGVKIDYLKEDNPLGTAGALGLLPAWDSTLLVINGDILTDINHRAMLTFHRENNAMMTVGVRQYEFEVPYGVVHTQGIAVKRFEEKPTSQFFVNAGIYLLEPEVVNHVVPDKRCDMSDLIRRLLATDALVVSFPISESWIDIGHLQNYEEAREAFARKETG